MTVVTSAGAETVSTSTATQAENKSMPGAGRLEAVWQANPKRHQSRTFSVISPGLSPWSTEFREIWEYRELIFNLAKRDLVTRYRQTLLGVAWALIQPVCMALAFFVLFDRVMHAKGVGPHYGLFVFAGLVVWQYFAATVLRASNSLLGVGGLMKKVHFPKLSVVIASLIPTSVDFGISFAFLLLMMAYFRTPISWQILLTPAFLLLLLANTLGIGLWLSATHIRFRDVHHIVPFALQLMLFVSPVGYSSDAVSGNLRNIYMLNPMVAVLDGFRYCILGSGTVNCIAVCASISFALLSITSGLFFFRRVQASFADYV